MRRAFNSWRMEAWYYLYIAPSLWWKDFKQVLNLMLLTLIAVVYLVPKGYIITKRENNEKIIDVRAFANFIGRLFNRTCHVFNKRFGSKE